MPRNAVLSAFTLCKSSKAGLSVQPRQTQEKLREASARGVCQVVGRTPSASESFPLAHGNLGVGVARPSPRRQDQCPQTCFCSPNLQGKVALRLKRASFSSILSNLQQFTIFFFFEGDRALLGPATFSVAPLWFTGGHKKHGAGNQSLLHELHS